MGTTVSHDLVLGRLRRDWSLGSDDPASPKAPTREEQLSQEIRLGPPAGHRRPSAKEMLVSRLREASPGGMNLYDELRPTYRDHQVIVRAKI